MNVRPARESDADELAGFLNACTLEYQGVSRSSRQDILARLHQDGSDPKRDSFLVLTSGELAGFAHVWRADLDEVRLFARTHPGAVGRGVGARLLELCETRARSLFEEARESSAVSRVTTTSWAADSRAPALLEGRGYEPIRYFVKMGISAIEVSESPPEWPNDVEVRLLAGNGSDEQSVYEAWLDVFADAFGPTPRNRAAFWEERRDAKLTGPFRFDPSLWSIVSDPEGILGFSFCEESTADDVQIGRVAEIGVRPRRRGQGIGYALLLHSFQQLVSRGAEQIVLDVDADNITSALRLYAKAGMTPHPSFTIWERRLNAHDAA